MQLFLTILNTGSISETGRRIGATQPSVSSSLRAMEEELGVRLIERSTGQRSPLKPTQQGALFAKFCRRTLDEYDQLRADIISPAERIDFSLCVTPSLHSFFAAVLYQSFCKKYPRVHCSYFSYRTVDAVKALNTHKCDLAVFAHETEEEQLYSEEFFYDPLLLVAPASMKLKPVIRPKDLKKLPMIIRDPSINSMRKVDTALKDINLSLDRLNIVLIVQGVMDELQSVALGHGCAFIPVSLLSSAIASESRISVIQVEGLEIPRHLRLACLKDEVLPTGARMFWEYAFSSQWRQDTFTHDTMKGISLIHSYRK